MNRRVLRFRGAQRLALVCATVATIAGCSSTTGSLREPAAPTTTVPTIAANGIVAYARRAPSATTIEFRRLGPGAQHRSVSLGKGVHAESLRWSPDGTTIVFDADIAGSGRFDIYTLRVSDDRPTRVTTRGPGDDTVSNGGPAWSPDGRSIAYFSNRGARAALFQPWVSRADGTASRRLAATTYPVSWLTWAHDARSVLFTEQNNLRSAIFSVPVAGGTPVPLAGEPGTQNAPDVSPDGTRIVYAAQVGVDRATHVYVMRTDGSDKRRLTDAAVADANPVWSPDGRRIAFLRTVDTGDGFVPDVFVMEADGTGVKNLTNTEATMERELSWAPDGSGLVFTSLVSGDDEISIVGARGGSIVSVSRDPGPTDSWATWSQRAASEAAVPPASATNSTTATTVAP